MKLVNGLLFGCAMLISSQSLAQGSSEDRAACTPDVWRLCVSSIPSVSAIVACLNKDKSKLSPACRVVMNKSGGAVQTAQTRSVGGTKFAWCQIGSDVQAEDVWKKWCGDAAWTE
jgi:hypothetical protein